MAAVDVDVVESALRDVNLSSGREIVLKPEQESALRTLLADRDVLAVLPTGYGKSLIYQMFVRAKNYELNGNYSNKRGWQAYTTFTSCQNAAYSNKVVFICWVDYALEGSAFILSKCDFSRMFHTERS